MDVAPQIERWPDLPATILVVPAASVDERRAVLRRLASHALTLPGDEVEIAHTQGQAPRLVRPAGVVLHLSSAGRGRVCALAVSSRPVGIDVERVEDAEPPWRVLHPDEAAHLAGLGRPERARAFARLWSLKEAYLKALGQGLARDPASFAFAFADEARAEISDPSQNAAVQARTSWRNVDGEVAVSAVTLAEPLARVPSPGGRGTG